jgi:hypothetical protein
MATYQILLLIASILSVYAGLHYVDARYNIRMLDWINGQCVNPFKRLTLQATANTHRITKEAEIEALKARVATLEKIVTEPAYELNQKINSLD